MAHRKGDPTGKRPHGSGQVLWRPDQQGRNIAIIRWPEYVITNGERHRKYRHETLGEVSARKAERELADRIASYRRRGPAIEKVYPTFSEHVDRWLRTIVPNKPKHSTRVGYRDVALKTLVPHFGQLRVSEITPLAAQEFFAAIQDRYELASLRAYRKVFRLIMEEALLWYGLEKNAAANIKLPRRKSKIYPTLSAEQAGALIGEIRSLKIRAMVDLALCTGMRRGELLACRWKSIDQAQRRILITEASYLGRLDTPKTGIGEFNQRSIALTKETLGLLADWRRQSKRNGSEDFVFATRTGQLDNPGNIMRRQIHPACDRLGLFQVSWLTFRRTFLTRGDQHLISPRTLADIAGHSNEDTQRIYRQPVEEAQRDAVEKLAGEVHRFCPDRSQTELPFNGNDEWVN